jgi:multidrug efflux pump subunit AcrA (membrane-fusion protein)
MSLDLRRLFRGRARSAAVVLAVLVAALVAAGLARTLDPDPVATVEVQRGRFVREVEGRGTLKAVKATPIVAPIESGRPQKVAFLAKDGAVVAAGDTVVEFDPYDAQKEEADGRDDLTAAQAKIDRAESDARKNERSHTLDRDVARDELDRAETFELTDEYLYTRHQIIESQLDKELYATRADVAGKKLDASGELSTAEKELGRIDAGKARLKLDIAEKSLASLQITAPHDGILVLERNWRGETAFVGDTLWPGQKIAEIPELTELEARVFVLEADGAGLEPGLVAQVAIEGRPGEVHEATVARVEPLAKTRHWGSPVRYFEATLSLASTDPETMKPGQRVRATIRLEEVEAVLSIPRGALFERDGERVVYRREGGRYAAVPVTVGRQSISRVVVEGGLEAGDHIALRDPSENAARLFGGEETEATRPAEAGR